MRLTRTWGSSWKSCTIRWRLRDWMKPSSTSRIRKTSSMKKTWKNLYVSLASSRQWLRTPVATSWLRSWTSLSRWRLRCQQLQERELRTQLRKESSRQGTINHLLRQPARLSRRAKKMKAFQIEPLWELKGKWMKSMLLSVRLKKVFIRQPNLSLMKRKLKPIRKTTSVRSYATPWTQILWPKVQPMAANRLRLPPQKRRLRNRLQMPVIKSKSSPLQPIWPRRPLQVAHLPTSNKLSPLKQEASLK